MLYQIKDCLLYTSKEGYKVLKTLLDTAMDFDRSRMYPGVPEYFDNDGRGLYSYLSLIHI